MKVALYARVSTDKQDLENQLRELNHYCAKNDLEIYQTFTDVISGGKSEKDRPAFARMLKDGRMRKFDYLVFWSLDRLSREGALQTLLTLNDLEANGVKWRSLTQPFLETLGPLAKGIQALVAALAEQEREQIRARVKAGLARAKSQGRIGGRPLAVNDKTVVVMQQLKDAGMSDRAIAKSLNISHRTVAKYLALAS